MTKLFNIAKEEFDWAGRKFTLETGKMARQADGAVIARYGDTSILCTVVGQREAKPDVDFFPLTIHYIEKYYAVGRIPGGFFKREGKPSETEVLTSRLVDRPIRPLFPEGFFNEVQVVCTILSHDQENDPGVIAIIGASAALSVSGIPFLGPLGAARIGYIDGEIKINPTSDEMKMSKLDLIVAGTESGVLMVESEAKELSESLMLDAVTAGHESFQVAIEAIKRLQKKAGKPAWEVISQNDLVKSYMKQIDKTVGDDLRKAYDIKAKQERRSALDQARLKATEAMNEDIENPIAFSSAIKKVEADILRTDILKDGKRLDGRDLKTIRPIEAEVGVLPRTHGSALFTRGETQALAIATLGTAQDEQIIDGIEGEYRQSFMLHYNFPPFSVGECGRMSGPGRREIGHGKLAWRAIKPMMPSKEEFPYAVRVVSEVLESNGSSSMATVCGTSLALMDSGVPLARPVAGIAMGLIKEGDDFAVLSDILGDEDHLGDMDFKVAGTNRGITALQMDIKITSVTKQIMEVALDQAKEGRLHILSEMSRALGNSRESVSEHAPRMVTIQINKDKIRDIIGPGGKVIREICETTQTKIDIDEEGSVTVSGYDAQSLDKAIAIIKGIACDPQIGEVYTGKVVKVMEFGAFVNFMGNKDGLVHVSEIAKERVANVRDYLKEGDMVKVKVVGFDKGKIKLSMKALLEDEPKAEEA